MKTILCLSLASVAGLALFAHQASRVAEVTKDVEPGTFDLGIAALTGQLAEQHAAALGLAQGTPLSAGEPKPIPEPTPEPFRASVSPGTPVLAIAEAWVDPSGLLWAKDRDNSLYLLLASGEWVAVQPSTRAGLSFSVLQP